MSETLLGIKRGKAVQKPMRNMNFFERIANFFESDCSNHEQITHIDFL